MRLRRAIVGAVLSAGGLLAPVLAHAYTYYFLISGDLDYMGPVWAQDPAGSTLKDQAQSLYEQVRELALSDRVNRYVIYYDPRGGVGFWWFSSRASKLEVYARGREVLSRSWSETDSTSRTAFQTMIRDSEMALRTWDSFHRFEDPVFLYYYGEHIGLRSAPLDESHPRSTMGLLEFEELLRVFWAEAAMPKVLLLHSCYMATVDLVRTLGQPYGITTHLLAPPDSISNTILNLEPLRGATVSPRELARRLVESQDRVRYKHDLAHFEIDDRLRSWLRQLERIEASLAETEFRSDVANILSRQELESAQGPVVSLSTPKEMILTWDDYLGLLRSYASDLTLMDRLQDSTQPEWARLRKAL